MKEIGVSKADTNNLLTGQMELTSSQVENKEPETGWNHNYCCSMYRITIQKAKKIHLKYFYHYLNELIYIKKMTF